MMKEVLGNFWKMVEKRDIARYVTLIVICLVLIVFLIVLRAGLTGFAVYFSDQPSAGQTTLMLQTADSDNLGDVYVEKATPNRNHGDKDYLKVQRVTWQRAYLKFNISAVPVGQIIDNASLCLFLDNDQGVQNISINHVYNDSWCEGDGGTDASPSCEITWNNQVCGTGEESLDGINCNTTVESILENDGSLDDTWQCWNIVDMIKTDYDSSDDLVSMILWTINTGNADIFHSKEYSDSNLFSYLNITYHTANVAPVININFPLDSTYGYNESIELNFSVSDVDGNLDSCWYNINDGSNVSLISCANTTFNVAGDGDYVLNIYANDTDDERASDSTNFSVQIGAPTIVLHFPIDEYLNYQENVDFNYTPTDIDLDSCELWGDFNGSFLLNQTNINPVNSSVNTFILNLSDGSYLWNIKCNDSVGNSAFNGNKTFYIDTINPEVSVSEPTGAKTSRTVSCVWSASDLNLDTCWYNVYRGESIEISNTSVNCSLSSLEISVTVDADFTFNFYTNDSAGNENSTNLNFSVDTSSPSPPTPDSGGSSGGGGGGYFPADIKGKMEVTQIGEIISYGGDEKTLSLNVKNVGTKFLNNCRLIAKGEISSWIFLGQVEGIAPGENIDFNFNLNIPEETTSGSYLGELEIKCDEGENIQGLVVTISGLSGIEIKEIIQKKDELTINYVFSEGNLIGQEVSMEIWILDGDEIEVSRIQDNFLVEKEAMERQVLMALPDGLLGIHSIYFASSSDLDSFVKKSIVLGKSRLTVGAVVLNTFKGKFTTYAIFLLVIGVAVFLIYRRHKKDNLHIGKSKNKWLLKKKRIFKNWA